MQEPAHAIAPGDRAPNFVLPDADGAFRMFYERAKGRPIVLLFFPGGRKGRAWREARAFARAADAFAAAGLDVFAVSLAEPKANAALGLPFLVWSDPKRAITRGYLTGAGLPFDPGNPADAAVAFALDANQRVLAVLSGDDLAARALRLYEARPDWGPRRKAETGAPVLLIPEVLDRAACRALIALWETGVREEGTVISMIEGRHVDRVHHSVKKRLDHRIMDPGINRALQRTIGRRIAPELEKAFCYEGFYFDRFYVVCYDSARGDYFRPHRDNLTPSTADRRFAITLNLNEDYEGGGLAFPEYGPEAYAIGAGGAIVFSCSLIHEALPVTRGRRFALLNFLRAPKGAAGGARRPGAAAG